MRQSLDYRLSKEVHLKYPNLRTRDLSIAENTVGNIVGTVGNSSDRSPSSVETKNF